MKRARSYLAGGMVLFLLALWCLGPLAWQFLTSIKTNAEITRLPATYWPREFTLVHYIELFTRKPFGRYLGNSLLISTCATILCLAVAAPAAFSLSRLRPRGSRIILALLLSVSLFPAITFVFPIYEMVRALGWVNHPVAVIVPYAAFNLPLSVFFLSAYFRTIPLEIIEAGMLDGLSRGQALVRLVLPLSAPGLVTTALLVFIASWNEFLFALTFLPRDDARTVTAGIASLSGGSLFEIPWGLIGGAIVLSVAPLLVLVAFFQRRIVAGLTQGSTVG